MSISSARHRSTTLLLAAILALGPGLAGAIASPASAGRPDTAAPTSGTACTFKPPKRAFLRWNQYDPSRISVNWTDRKGVTSYTVILFALEGTAHTWVAGTVPGGYRGLSVTMNDIRGQLETGYFRASVYAHKGKCYSDGSANTSGNIDNSGYYSFADPAFTTTMRVKKLISKTYRVDAHYYVDKCGKLYRRGVPVVLPRAVKDRAVDAIIAKAVARGLTYVIAPEGLLGKLAFSLGMEAGKPLIRKFTPRAVYCLIP